MAPPPTANGASGNPVEEDEDPDDIEEDDWFGTEEEKQAKPLDYDYDD
jgi:hypothetical protein